MSDDVQTAVKDGERLLAELQSKHSEASNLVDTIVERRKPLALSAELGDATSKKQLARLVDEERAAEMRARDLQFAIDAARGELDKAKARAAAADLEKRRAAYDAHATVALEAAREMDRAAAALSAAQRRLKQAHADLSATGITNGANLNRLIFRASATRALVSHGFAAFTDLPRFGDPLGNQSFEALVSGVVGAPISTKRDAA